MNRSEYLSDVVLVEKAKKPWTPTAKLVLAFILGFLALTPAILGIYWELILSG